MDEREIAVPHVDVGMIEEEALHFAGHVGGADDGEGFAIDGEVIGIDAEGGAGAQESFIANPEGGVVDGADRGCLRGDALR